MKRVEIKMQDDLFNTLTIKASALGTTNSSYIRSLILDKEIVNVKTNKDLSKLIGLVAKFGNNINQMSHNLNIAHNRNLLKEVDYNHLIILLTSMNNDISSTLND